MGLLYTNMKMFHFKDKIDSLPKHKGDVLAPIHIRLKPTNVCNHNCSYCAYRAKDLQLGQDMNDRDFIPHDKMMEILDDIIEMGVNAITFSGGGEPFCYPFFVPTLKKLSNSNVKFACLTNGSKLVGEAASLCAHNATWLRVSLDGWDSSSYSKYRGCSEKEFATVMNNMKLFKQIGGSCFLSACIAIDKSNFQHLYEMVKELKSIGVDSVKFSPCIISNDYKVNNDYHRSILELAQKQIAKAVDEFTSDAFEIYNAYHVQLNTFEKEYNWCPYLQMVPVIAADQNVYACQDKAYNLETGFLGSIKNQRFKNFWFDNKENFFKIDPSRVCNHHCVRDNSNKSIFNYLNADKEHLEFV